MSGEREAATAREPRSLEGDPRSRELGGYVPPLSVLRAFGAVRDERSPTRARAHVLNPSRVPQAPGSRPHERCHQSERGRDEERGA